MDCPPRFAMGWQGLLLLSCCLLMALSQDSLPRIPDYEIKTWLGKDYDIKTLLGKGWHLETYKAIYLPENRTCAIKVVRASKRQEGEAMFQHELKMYQHIPYHPNLVRMYRRGNHSGTSWMDMELCHGKVVSELFPPSEKGPFAVVQVKEVLYWFRQLFRALAALHQAGVVHTDVHESNVMFDISKPFNEPSLRLLDYNRASLLSDLSYTKARNATQPHNRRAFSPERANHWPHYDRAKDDVFAAALIMSKLVTGWCTDPKAKGKYKSKKLGKCHDIFANSLRARWLAVRKATARHYLYGRILEQTLGQQEQQRLSAADTVKLFDRCILELENNVNLPGLHLSL
eukprot:g80440.t1